MTTIWRATVLDIIHNKYGYKTFTRKKLIQECIMKITSDTNSIGKTPAQTLSRILQNLRDEGFLLFMGRGTYKLKDYEKISPKGPSKGEKLVERILNKIEVAYETQQRFGDMRDKGYLSLDFYLLGLSAAIEFDGAQHYRPVEYFGGEDALQKTIKRDKKKSRYCKKRGIALLRLDKLDAAYCEKAIIGFLENLEEDAMYRGIGNLLA
ncbi:hypothetical protein BNJ_00313 [Kaumoebavirus]|uniref:homing endonuclease n=1 Tax=Kaumoebavirus TaxID=1859492 RepID=UPI0009C26506|nr:homing endonuclease [Kaumoebavirus]ARA72135.1 hypothetical protein BNJ_00313 [Kaumoebavirus]